jgi:predicted Fe-Mo cluster-binding NifX family protein
MKIAIPLFKERVAPHFGSSSEILLVEIHSGSVYQEARWDVGSQSPLDMARRLVDLGIEKIICGGINRFEKEWLIEKEVSVEDNRKGEARDIVKKLLVGKDTVPPATSKPTKEEV